MCVCVYFNNYAGGDWKGTEELFWKGVGWEKNYFGGDWMGKGWSVFGERGVQGFLEIAIISFPSWLEMSVKKGGGVLTRKGWRKRVRERVVTLKEAMAIATTPIHIFYPTLDPYPPCHSSHSLYSYYPDHITKGIGCPSIPQKITTRPF